MSYNFPSSNYTSDDEYDVDFHTSPFHEISESQTSFSPIVSTQFTHPTTSTQLLVTETSKGALCLQVDGYCYTKHRMTQDVTQWHCIQRGICKAILHTKENVVISKKNEHNHESNSNVFENYRIKAGIKRKASERQEGTHSIITSSINQLNEEAAVHLPKINTLKRTIVRSRKKSNNVPPEPTSLTSLELSEFYKISDKGDRFQLRFWILK